MDLTKGDKKIKRFSPPVILEYTLIFLSLGHSLSMLCMFLSNYQASVEICMHRCTKNTLWIIPDLLTFDIKLPEWRGDKLRCEEQLLNFRFLWKTLCVCGRDCEMKKFELEEKSEAKRTEKAELSSCLCCITSWHCPLQDLSFLLGPRGCCRATQCGAHTYTQTHIHTHTSTNNGLLYEVPTDAMVTSSFWA